MIFQFMENHPNDEKTYYQVRDHYEPVSSTICERLVTVGC